MMKKLLILSIIYIVHGCWSLYLESKFKIDNNQYINKIQNKIIKDNLFQNIIINNESTYLKVFSKLFFVILIIVFYDI